MIENILKENPNLIKEVEGKILEGNLVFLSLAGSRAYRLNHEDSDLDIRGAYIAPVEKFLGLETPKPQYDEQEPDSVIYELGKFTQLAVNANPVALEAMFTEDILYKNDIGEKFLENKNLFLSQNAKARYIGYAKSQILKVEKLIDGEAATGRFKDATKFKHLRHTFRLLDQVENLLETGTLNVEVTDKEYLFERASLPLPELKALAEKQIERIDAINTSLPLKPDLQKINELLISLRKK